MRRTLRTMALLLTSVTAAGALPTAALGSSAAVRHCPTAQLRLRTVQMQAATGHRYIDYAFKNVAPMRCSLRGYPYVVLLNRHGRRMGATWTKVGHWSLSPVRTVVIDPGKRAFFTFTWVDGGFCPSDAFSFYGLQAFPPANRFGFGRHFIQTPACRGSAMVSAVRPKLFSF